MKQRKMKTLTSAIAMTGLVALTACQRDPESVTNIAQTGEFVDIELGVNAGKRPISQDEALEIYKGVCIDHRSPRRFGLSMNPASKTWTSDTLSLSLVRTSGEVVCSFIFLSEENEQQLVNSLTEAAAVLTSENGSAKFDYGTDRVGAASYGNGIYVESTVFGELDGYTRFNSAIFKVE